MTFGEAYNSVTYINGKTNGYHQARIGNTTLPEIIQYARAANGMITIFD